MTSTTSTIPHRLTIPVLATWLPQSMQLGTTWGCLTKWVEAVGKFTFGGFDVNRFCRAESHFQMGFSWVSVAGWMCEKPNSRDSVQPIAKCTCGEEEAIGEVLLEFDRQMMEHVKENDCVLLSDGSIRIKLADPIRVRAKNGEIVDVIMYRPTFSADVKAILLALNRMCAAANRYCFFNLDFCERSVNHDRIHPVSANTTMGDLRRIAWELVSMPEYPEWKAYQIARDLPYLKKDYNEWKNSIHMGQK